MTKETQKLQLNIPVFVYEFLYNSDCCESKAATMSIHRTKKGAVMVS